MKFENPTVETLPRKNKEETLSFEEKKDEFSKWTDEYLSNLYSGSLKINKSVFHDPVSVALDQYFPDQVGYATKDKAQLTKIFISKLVDFSNKMLFKEDFSPEMRRNFFQKIYKQFFGRSPDIFANLNNQFAQKILISSQVNETYGLQGVPDNSGEIVYDLSFSDDEIVEDLISEIQKMQLSEKLSVIKQLSQCARRALGGGSWANPAFERTREIISVLNSKETNPIVSFISDFELKKIDNYLDKVDPDRYMASLESYETYSVFGEPHKDVKQVVEEVKKESDEFYKTNAIRPELDNNFYTKVSKDFGSLISSNTLVPFALVQTEEKVTEKKESINLSLEQIKMLKSFLNYIENKKDFDVQTYVDITDVTNFIQNLSKAGELLKDLDQELLKSIFELREKISKLDKKLEDIEISILNDEERKQEVVLELGQEYNAMIIELADLGQKIPLDLLNNVISELLDKDKDSRNVLPIKSYEGLTLQKDLNPLGNEDFSHLVKIFHQPEVRYYINKRLNIKIEDLYLKEQIHLLRFLSEANEEKFQRFESILIDEKNNQNILKSFLSMSGDKAMGDKILTLGEKLPEDSAKMLFAKYSEYIDHVDQVENFVNSQNLKQKPNIETINKIKETLLLKGRDILLSQYEKIASNTFDFSKFEIFINNAKADVDLFKNTFKTTIEENPELEFEEFLNLKANTLGSKEVKNKTEVVNSIKNMIVKNYSDEKLQKAVLDSFEKSLENENTKISVLERDGKIIACDRLDFNEDKTLYFGTFNVDPDYCSAKIGNAFFKSTVMPYMRENIIKADCSVRQPISAYYIESGFVVDKIYDYQGEPSFSIVTMPKEDFESKKMSKEEIINMSNLGQDRFLIRSFENQADVALDYPLNKKLTRFFLDKNSKKWFAVWE